MKLPAGLAALVACAALAGCGGGSTSSAAQPASTPTPPIASPTPSPSPSACPPADTGQPWPKEVPADLPRPPGVRVIDVQNPRDAVQVVRFTTPTSLRQSVLFVVEQLPKAGFVLGRGDAEPSEADAPFVRGDVRGAFRMVATEPCQTTWVLTTVRANGGAGGTSPLLPHPPSQSPLPFG